MIPLSLVIPAQNEAGLIGGCLTALLAASGAVVVQVIVAANGCTDDTVAIARGFMPQAIARGWQMLVLDLPAAGKPAALNAADAAALHPARAYLDADVTVSPGLIERVIAVLDQPAAAYASGEVAITGQGWVSRSYAAMWGLVPFMAQGVPGCGFFAVNGPGRARWAKFPAVISDDTFVRLQFRPGERHLVTARYDWPVAQGFAALVRVRRRQDAGVAEVARLYPALMPNDGTPALGAATLCRMAMLHPAAFAVYACVALMVRLSPASMDWSRGR